MPRSHEIGSPSPAGGVEPMAAACSRRGFRHLRMAVLDDGAFRPLRRAGVSRRARRGNFAGCGQRPGALPLDSAIRATRRRLARGVGEEFCVRARRSFAAILDVWQEAGPQLWRKRPSDTRRHTGGKLPHRKKLSKTFNFVCWEGDYFLENPGSDPGAHL